MLSLSVFQTNKNCHQVYNNGSYVRRDHGHILAKNSVDHPQGQARQQDGQVCKGDILRLFLSDDFNYLRNERNSSQDARENSNPLGQVQFEVSLGMPGIPNYWHWPSNAQSMKNIITVLTNPPPSHFAPAPASRPLNKLFI
jgi:hypothetical protein